MTVGTARPTAEAYSVWKPQRKSAEEAEEVKAIYERFAACHDIAHANLKRNYLDKLSAQEKDSMTQAMADLGLILDWDSCHIRYAQSFEPIKLDYDLCYVRHGKTEGNTEPRIFQGFCDYWENQLNEVGKQQAIEAADKMENTMSTFKPDLILCSPLGRAIETGEAFFRKHPEIPCRVHYEAREQQFGCWDNMQLRYMNDDDMCHLFYLDQNVLVKAPRPHISGDKRVYESENFVDLIRREASFLKMVNDEPEVKSAVAQGRKAKVLIYGHSMAGAAISVLLGHGKRINDAGDLGFDGKFIMPNATPTMLIAKKPE